MTKEVRQTPRAWQDKALDAEKDYLRSGGDKPLLAACPGAGKTLYGIRRACRFFNDEDGKLVIVVAPTTNIKLAWITAFRHHGFRATGGVDNSLIRERLQYGESAKGDYEVIVITYSQLAKGRDLFPHYPERYRTLVIADEVHHADDQASFGYALAALSDAAHARLALSGTPFNSQGGALAMCDSEQTVNEDGQIVQRTKAFYSYGYGEALRDGDVCRPIEFGIVYGEAQTTYRSLLTGSTFQKLTNGQRRTDSLRPLLDVDGEFLSTMLDQGIKKLDAIKEHHRRAAMLIVAQNSQDAAAIENMLFERCGTRYSIQRILHDTERAHERIERLNKDNTDIVVTVRMISEGIDVKRFRVGIYASDYLTRMFFVQFVGRFVRWDSDLSLQQYATLIFPGHILLVEYAREIEQMIVDADLAAGGPKLPKDGPGDWLPPVNLREGVVSNATGQEIMDHRGHVLDNEDAVLLEEIYARSPDLRGQTSDHLIVEIARVIQNKERKPVGDSNDPAKELRKKNNTLVSMLCRLHRKMRNGSVDNDRDLFGKINGKANDHVGIRKMDELTSIETLEARRQYLERWSRHLLKGVDPETFDG